MAGRKKKMWFGFLEAGTKGSPVVRDAGLETGDAKTVYLFNYMKGRILEYRREIVEFKLRELEVEELAMVPELRSAYNKVRETFQPRVSTSPRVVPKPKPAPIADDFPEFDGGDDDEHSEDGASLLVLDNDDEGDSANLLY